jgi:hypothetical protein
MQLYALWHVAAFVHHHTAAGLVASCCCHGLRQTVDSRLVSLLQRGPEYPIAVLAAAASANCAKQSGWE